VWRRLAGAVVALPIALCAFLASTHAGADAEAQAHDAGVREFIARMNGLPRNRALRAEVEAIARAPDVWGQRAGPVSEATFLFVPGWLYRADPSTGADLAAQRRALAARGMRVALAAIDENDTVQSNAARIAAEIRARALAGERLVLVSASKGGPESALALDALAGDPAVHAVAAWINIGGILRGSPLADWSQRWPVCWLINPALWFKGIDIDAVRSMRVTELRERFERARLPTHLLVVNIVGAPLAHEVSPRARDGHRRLAALGPNDGLTMLDDAVVESGLTLVEPGLDHFFDDPAIEARTIAIAYWLLTSIARNHGPAARSQSSLDILLRADEEIPAHPRQPSPTDPTPRT
jgi:hypothetical protein